MTPNAKLIMLNAFRVAEGKAPLADWRQPRHQPMLDAYVVAADARQAEVDRINAEFAQKANAKPTIDPEEVAPVSVSGLKLPAYKVLAAQSDRTSSIDSPVKFIHGWLDENPDTKRKVAVATLVGLGVNYSTARTQYQRWSSARKGK